MRGLLVDLTPLRTSRDYRHIWYGGALTGMANSLSAMAVGLQVYDLTGDTLAVGVVGFASLVPLVAFGLYGGSIVDAHDRRKVLLATIAGLVAVATTLTLLSVTGTATVALLYALVAIQSGLYAVHQPARSAVIPRLVSARLIPAAAALGSLAMGISLMVGPLFAGFLVDFGGYGLAYSAQLALLAAAVVLLFTLPSLLPEGEPTRAGMRSVLEGLRYLKTRPTLGMTFLVDIFAMVLAMPRVLFPAVGVVILGGDSRTAGILASAIAAGSLLGGIFSGRIGRIDRQGRAIVVAVAFWGLFITAFGVVLTIAPGPPPGGNPHPLIWPAAIFLGLAGFSDTVSAIFRSTILQVATPDAYRGRLQGVFTVVVAGGPHLGALVLGSFASRFGEDWAAIVGGILCTVAVVVVALLQKGLLAYDAREPGAEERRAGLAQAT
ncbi:MAG TPA: MFS transporter [Acidimicrobiia bacterium]